MIKSSDWSYCPACGGEIDTGYECNKCGRDWYEWHETRSSMQQKMQQLKIALTPRLWPPEYREAWNNNLCDMDKAFSALRTLAEVLL